MKPIRRSPATITVAVSCVLCANAMAFPPAPHHELYGSVRDERGNPLSAATVHLLGTRGSILNGPVDQTIAPGVNYSLKIPMDAGTLTQLYLPTALRPAMPFTVKVTAGGADYVPIEVRGGSLEVGDPGARTRLDLTLGIDSDSDGLPDAWEQDIIDNLDGIDTLAEVTRDGDADSDGVSNYIEYLAGTYAFDRRATFDLDIIGVRDGMVHLRFLAVKGRSYQISSSADLKTFTAAAFSLNADGSRETTVHLARQIRHQDVYLPANTASKHFRLHVH
jgi:hypothetical protein